MMMPINSLYASKSNLNQTDVQVKQLRCWGNIEYTLYPLLKNSLGYDLKLLSDAHDDAN